MKSLLFFLLALGTAQARDNEGATLAQIAVAKSYIALNKNLDIEPESDSSRGPITIIDGTCRVSNNDRQEKTKIVFPKGKKFFLDSMSFSNNAVVMVFDSKEFNHRMHVACESFSLKTSADELKSKLKPAFDVELSLLASTQNSIGDLDINPDAEPSISTKSSLHFDEIAARNSVSNCDFEISESDTAVIEKDSKLILESLQVEQDIDHLRAKLGVHLSLKLRSDGEDQKLLSLSCPDLNLNNKLKDLEKAANLSIKNQ